LSGRVSDLQVNNIIEEATEEQELSNRGSFVSEKKIDHEGYKISGFLKE